MIPKTVAMLAKDLARYYSDPLGYVKYMFPWGEPGTPLVDQPGPRAWQEDILRELGEQIKARAFNHRDPVAPIQISIASGHSIGKSALTAWLIKFLMDTRPFAKGVVTANTADQLRTKTWSELAKWHNMSLTREFFNYSNSQGHMSMVSVTQPHTWRCDAMTCREENSESFAGLHAVNSTPFYIFDEASAIPEKIFEVAQGGLVDGEPMIFLFGNPTRNTGFFRETHGSRRARWTTRQIDSRTVDGTNKELYETWAQDYGADSDFFKVRVKGEFPSAGVCQLIPTDFVDAARGKHCQQAVYQHMPVILGVDVARFGSDRSAIYKRQGLASWKLLEARGLSVVQLADAVARLAQEHNADAVFVDEGGVGGGVVDTLRERLHLDNVQGINFGGKPNDARRFLNKRAEMWWALREWLGAGGCIPDRVELADDLISVEYQYRNEQQIQLEKKEDMKKRGLDSPDEADALALTFAMPVASRQQQRGGRNSRLCDMDDDVLSM